MVGLQSSLGYNVDDTNVQVPSLQKLNYILSSRETQMRSEITMPFPSLPQRRSEPVVSELIKFLQSVGAAGNFYSNPTSVVVS